MLSDILCYCECAKKIGLIIFGATVKGELAMGQPPDAEGAGQTAMFAGWTVDWLIKTGLNIFVTHHDLRTIIVSQVLMRWMDIPTVGQAPSTDINLIKNKPALSVNCYFTVFPSFLFSGLFTRRIINKFS